MDKQGQTVKAFCNECRWVRAVYDQYTQLFDAGEERLKLLEEIAANFFSDLLRIYKSYLLSLVCKLTDPAKTGGNFNLTINYLIEYLPWQSDVKDRLITISKELDRFRDYIVPARHKIFSHADLSTTLAGTSLGKFPEGEEKAFWNNLQEFVNIAHAHFFDSVFPIESTSKGDVNDMIEAMKKAVDYDDFFKDKQKDKLQRSRSMKYAGA